MGWIYDNIGWIMLASGVFTLTMLQAVIAPKAALKSLFGETLDGTLAETVVRSWGALIALVGAALIYGAFDEALRPAIMIAAGASKAFFIAVVLAQGSLYLRRPIAIGVAADFATVVLFALYLTMTGARF